MMSNLSRFGSIGTWALPFVLERRCGEPSLWSGQAIAPGRRYWKIILVRQRAGAWLLAKAGQAPTQLTCVPAASVRVASWQQRQRAAERCQTALLPQPHAAAAQDS